MEEWYRWAAKGRTMPITDAALAYVLDNRPSEAGVSVLWGDPTPSNTMFRPDGTVAALVDWELAALGPPEIVLEWRRSEERSVGKACVSEWRFGGWACA